MADNSTMGSTTDVIATDDDGTAKHQYVKLEFGADNVYTKVDFANPLPVVVEAATQRISVAAAGLTNVTYAAGDQLGNLITLTGASRASGGSGYIRGITLVDAADIIGQVDVVIFDTTVTLAADNAAFAISDADALRTVALVQLAGAFDIGNNRICQANNLAIPFVCNGTSSLFAAMITRTANAGYATATDIRLIVYVDWN